LAQREYCATPDLNPFRAYDKRDLKEVKKQRFLTKEEFRTLQRNCAKLWQELLLFTAVSTGLRHEELAGLKVSDIDFDNDLINVRAEIAKGGKARTVPILRDLWRHIKDHCDKSECDYVFSCYNRVDDEWVRFQSFKNFFNNARTRAGMRDVRFHDLRHTFASWWLQDGGDLETLSVILDHESVKTTERYAHLTTDATRRAAQERRWTQFWHNEEKSVP
jgi:integrase